MKKTNIIIILLLTFIAVGCAVPITEVDNSNQEQSNEQQIANTQETERNNEPVENPEVDGDSMEMLFSNSYREFSQEEFESAKAADYYIVLDFYSTWCPKCNEEDSILSENFNNLENVVIFKVNHGDPETTEAEELLAEEFGVTNRATGIILKGASEVSRYDGHQSEDGFRELFNSFI